MDKFIVQGPTPLQGTISVSGSKNAALPLMAATLLTEEPSVIENIPRLQDIRTFSGVIRGTGTDVIFDEELNRLSIHAGKLSKAEAPYDLVRKMRASFYMLGALAGRCGQAKVSLPGGCAWGPRPVDLHLKGLEAMGYEIRQEAGYIYLHGPDSLAPSSFSLHPSSVGATVNLVLAAVLRSEEFILHNAAMEPDVVQLCEALQQMGADIDGVGSATLRIRKVPRLNGLQYANAPDRIEAGTYLLAGIMHPESDITVQNFRLSEMGSFMDQLQKTGATLSTEIPSDAPGHYRNLDSVRIIAPAKLDAVSVQTEIYPGFPTDLQAQWATVMTQASGMSHVCDTIYIDRFSYVPELARLGAHVRVERDRVVINGPTALNGASIMSTDLRASVSLVMAAMIARGTTDVLRVYHLDRGYEELEVKLNNIGANIERISE